MGSRSVRKTNAATRMLLLIKTISDLQSDMKETSCTVTISMLLDRMAALRSKSHEDDGAHISRTQVLKDLHALEGLDLPYLNVTVKKGRNGGCTIKRPMISPLQDRTLSVIVDACSFISKRDADGLYKALTPLMSEDARKRDPSKIYVDAREHAERNPTLEAIEIITQAQKDGAVVTFSYETRAGSFNDTRDRKDVTVIPITLVYSFGNFYLDALPKPTRGRPNANPTVFTYRLDRMSEVVEGETWNASHANRIEELRAETQQRTAQTFDAFRRGQLATLIIRYTRTAEFDMEERFGKIERVLSEDGMYAYAQVKVYPAPTFFRWVFGWGEDVVILDPSCDEFKDNRCLNSRFAPKSELIAKLQEDFRLVMCGYDIPGGDKEEHVPGYRDYLAAQCRLYMRQANSSKT